MRLLNIDTMRVEECSPHIPEYAILSHTLGHDEVSFQDIHHTRAKKMRGYIKIKHACNQAQRDGYEYLWIDTCCIDKTSSSELSEAINSMFGWYQAAGVCYVFLEDVNRPRSTRTYQRPRSTTDFEKSRWMSRGWTLQELIAPKEVKLYSADWAQSLGTRQTLAKPLAHATGISKLLLRNPDLLPTFSIATRMSWASSRETTRVEDVAYCLLGIFGVNMPLLYGEGTKAFVRLQEELVKISADESIFAWDGEYNLKEDHGLQIHVPLLSTRVGSFVEDENHLAVLNCHYDDDFSRYIALPLYASQNVDVFYRVRYDYLEKNLVEKVRTVSSEEVRKLEVRTIYITKRNNVLHHGILDSVCWLKCDPIIGLGYEVSCIHLDPELDSELENDIYYDTHPPKQYTIAPKWNPESRTLRAPDASARYGITTLFKFRKQGGATSLCVWLNHRHSYEFGRFAFLELTEERANVSFVGWLEKHSRFIDIDEYHELCEQDTEQSLLVSFGESGAPPTHKFTATLDEEELMGKAIWVLHIALTPYTEQGSVQKAHVSVALDEDKEAKTQKRERLEWAKIQTEAKASNNDVKKPALLEISPRSAP